MNTRHILATVTVLSLFVGQPARSADPVKPEPSPVANSSNAFCFDFYQKLAAEPGNLFYSPLSIHAAFSMLGAGAEGQTLEQIMKTLHLNNVQSGSSVDLAAKLNPNFIPNADFKAAHAAYRDLFAKINNDKIPADQRGFQLTLANALWGSKTYPWRKEYLKVTSENYGAGLFETDFNQPEPARLKINKWVEDQTNNKIKDLLPSGSITEDTRMVLTNAIYFKSKWEKEFDKKNTKDLPFTLANGKTKNVPMMYVETGLPYYENDTWQAVEIPYKGKETSMIVLLPKKRNGLSELQKSVDAKLFDEVTSKLRNYSLGVHLTLPRFKLNTLYPLNEKMKQLGIVDAFDAEKANLKGMHSHPIDQLYVSAAFHKAFVEVNEEGTEAAAATAVVASALTSSGPIKPVFQADHPFLFAIRHKPTNAILFFGKVENMD